MEGTRPLDAEDIRVRLNEHGLKATHQRIRVYALMCRLGHASADTVYQQLGEDRGRMTLATVYNVLESMTEAGLLALRPSFSNKMFFDVNTDAHFHLYRKDTGEIMDLHDAEFQQRLEARIRERMPAELSLDDVEIQILCHEKNEG